MATKSRKSRKTGSGAVRVARAASVVVLAVCFTIALMIVMLAFATLLAPMSRDIHAKPVLFTVKRGWGPREIGTMLEKQHLIRKALGFRLAMRIDGMSSRMRAGQYELSPAMSPRQMAELISLGQTSSSSVTIPEGFTVDQIAARLDKQGLINRETFLTLARTQGKSFHIRDFSPPSDNLEGFLYPDTYNIPKAATERDIITMMLAAFRTQALNRDGGALAKRGQSLEAIITLASLVEREAQVDKDRPLIAAALVNRLNKKMPLQCDASLEYAMPQHKGRLYFSDYKVDSPYNTYLHLGLTPTPIANPGWSSIKAAMNPADVNYLYYVARKDGSHAFAVTFEDFKRIKAQLVADGERA